MNQISYVLAMKVVNLTFGNILAVKISVKVKVIGFELPTVKSTFTAFKSCLRDVVGVIAVTILVFAMKVCLLTDLRIYSS